ncbi:MAG: NUDIX hydrolase [Verrucomicrobiota bacterium]
MIKPWPVKSSEQLGDFHIFKLRADWKTSPRTHKDLKFLVLECVNWVNVIAVTPEDQLVMVEQFRHGSGTVELEIPGGVMDPHDASPVEAGLRELSEETGFEGEGACVIGQVFANPAIMNNTCYTVLVRNCRFTSATRFDHGEDIVTRLVPIADIPELVRTGKIRHSLVVVAFYHFENWRRTNA